MKKYEELAKFIIENVGGESNVISLTHCVTRLRFILKDEGKANTEALNNRDDVLGVIQKGGQYQVVIGNAVEDVYDEVLSQGKFAAGDDSKQEQEEGIFNTIVAVISGIFTPLLGLMCGCGIIKGFMAFFVAMKWLAPTSGTVVILNAIGDVIFYFFPIFVGYSAAKKFKMNEYIGGAIGASLVYPSIVALAKAEPLYQMFAGTMFESNVTANLFGIPVMMMGYASTVIPAILAVWVGSKIEKLMKQIIPTVLKMFLVPAITLVLTVSLTLIVVGPVATWLSDIIGFVFVGIRNISPVLCGALVGGFWQVLVMFGIHQGLTPIGLNNLIAFGYENVLCNMQCVPFVTCAVVFSIYLKTKDKKLKEIALPAAISSFMGVSEPSIYGVTLPLKKPFIITLISSAIGGAIMGFFDVKKYTMGGLGLFAFPAYINPETGFDMSFYGTIIAVLVAMACGFILTWMFGYKNEEVNEEKPNQSLVEVDGLIKQEIYTAPVAGEVVPLEKVNDNVFASGIVGKGIAVKPSEGKIYAPCDGEAMTVFPTGHAIGIKTSANAELLIHIGIDTVQLDGKGFKTHIKQGDMVKKGQLLVEFDQAFIKEQGYDDTVMFVVTNSNKFLDVIAAKDEKADQDKELLAIAI
ncbi:MAG: beta-glucoside-specific PTS transporter subunit IIABC [Erysipelotrichaceae bacterium]|nr:beta-glucoside-specific PTS transporter subunit IIABC [Erysipelotrichaceae bacterium]MDY5253028.1 beta-glucoside-specific PTS transporter subunit IIABC [Erysipelotrichaceae bacterium]